MQPQRSNRGFTLVEVLVVLAIIGAGFLLMPNLVEMIRGSQLEQTGREAAVLLQKARLSAIKQTAPAVVMVDGSTVFAFLDRNPDGAFKAADGDEEIGRIEIRRGVEPVPTTYKPTFTSTGSVSEAGDFTFENAKGDTIKIEIGPVATGHIEVVK